MNKQGCECEDWEDEWAFSGIDPTLKYEEGVWQELTRAGWGVITKCPFCEKELAGGAE